MKELIFGKKLASTLMSAALVVAFAPAFVAPQPAKALTNDEETAIAYIKDWSSKKGKITLNGSDAKGTFNPESSIQRSEVAAILVRMMDAHYRVDAPAELGK